MTCQRHPLRDYHLRQRSYLEGLPVRVLHLEAAPQDELVAGDPVYVHLRGLDCNPVRILDPYLHIVRIVLHPLGIDVGDDDGEVGAYRLADIALLLKAHPEVQKEWRPALDRTGLTKFSRTVLGAMDALFSTTFSGSTGDDRFIKLYVRQEGTKLSRILAKYRYLPRRPQEAFREMVAKLTRVIRHRLPF